MNLKSLSLSPLGAVVALVTLTGVNSVHAVSYAESGDAGQTLATAVSTANFGSANFGQPLTAITGTVGVPVDADLYRIFISSPAGFSATTTVNGTALDTALFLFDLSGRAVIANDDASGFTLQSTIPANTSTVSGLPSGVYFLGISLSGNEPVNSANQLLFAASSTDTTALRTAASGLNPATLSTFNGLDAFAETGNYTITLTGATAVPEPSTWALFGTGVLALGLTVARRNRQVTARVL